MRRKTLLITMLLLSVALPVLAKPQQQESLGNAARQIRAQHDKNAKKPTRVFTNDNLPAPVPGEAITYTPAPPAPAKPSTPAETNPKPATPASETSSKPESPEDKKKTRDHWQEKFKAARQSLAKAKELQQLSEDELNLLQIQEAREMDVTAKADLTSKVQAKQSEAALNRTTTQAAQKVLDDLQKQFEDSGAPDDWSKTE